MDHKKSKTPFDVFDQDYVINAIMDQIEKENISLDDAINPNKRWVIQGTDNEGKLWVWDGPLSENILRESFKRLQKKKN